ncbi:MAG: peptide-binding protein, partial [Mucilaginibacter sp.]|nr:peptide-binding protein [Mucilaginibacter sp.]
INNSFHPHVWFKNSKDVFEHNIVSAAYFPIGITSWGSKVDYNFFPDSASLHKEQSRGTDEHALYGDPGFANVTTGDYNLPKNSPILKAGFKNFPMNKFGVVSPALKKLANKIIIPPYKIAQTQKAQQTYSFMGVTVKDLNTLSERSATGMDSERGVIVLDISDKSKLKGIIYPNDVILSVQNVSVQHVNDLARASIVSDTSAKLIFGIFRNQKLNKIVFIQK